MARYIDADLLCDSLRESYNHLFDIYKKSKDNDSATICEGQLNTFMECIIRTNTQPTADVVEVKHGEWMVRQSGKYWHYDCPFCDDGFLTESNMTPPPNYCQNCGAKMDGGNAE